MGKKRILKYICYAAAIIGIPLFLEIFVFNFHALNKEQLFQMEYAAGGPTEYDWGHIEERERGIHIEFNEPQYISKLQFQFQSDFTLHYKLYLSYVNQFGAEVKSSMPEAGEEIDEESLPEGTYIRDRYAPQLGAGFTNIGKKLTAIDISAGNSWKARQMYVRLYNEFSFNKFRVMFWMIAVALAVLFAERKKWFAEKPEWIAVIVILLLGSISIYSQGINEDGWDEQVHFSNIYRMANGKELAWNDAAAEMESRVYWDFYNTQEERSLSIQRMNNLSNSNAAVVQQGNPYTYNRVAYVFQCLAVFLAQTFNMPFHLMIMFGRFINLLSYAAVMFFAIRLVPIKKTEVCALALIPTQIFIAGTFSYDTFINMFLMLGLVFWMKVIFEERGKFTDLYIGLSFSLMVVGSLTKAIYIPLVLLCLLIPAEKFRSPKWKKWIVTGISALFVIGVCTFALPAVYNTMQNNVGWRGDLRAKDGIPDVVLQMQSILAHPMQYLGMLFGGIVKTFPSFLLGLDGIANYGRLRTISEEFTCITAVWMMFVLFFQQESGKGQIRVLQKKYKAAIVGISLIIICFIWTAMYLDFTPVGSGRVNGVQARYYAPLLLPFVLLFTNRRFRIQADTANYRRIMMGVPTALAMVGIYTMLLQGYCF